MEIPELQKMRKEIDACDVELLPILTRRAKISVKIGAFKKEHGISARDKKREAELLAARVTIGKKKGLSPTFVKKLFKLIHDESVRIQSRV